MDFVSIFILFLTVAATVFAVFVALNADMSCKQRTKIVNAIFVYDVDTTINYHKRPLVTLDDIENIDDTFRRWWDWGYKRILPPDKLAIIEPYIPLVSSSYNFEKILKGYTIKTVDDIALILNGGITPMESKNINNTQKVTSFDDIIPINDRPEPMDKMDNFDPDHKV